MYEDFVNVSGHDINLMRYFFGMPENVGGCFYKSGTGAVCIVDYDMSNNMSICPYSS